jgi:hypothetical protein
LPLKAQDFALVSFLERYFASLDRTQQPAGVAVAVPQPDDFLALSGRGRWRWHRCPRRGVDYKVTPDTLPGFALADGGTKFARRLQSPELQL